MIRKVPRHIAIIMDGNGRWASRRNVSRAEGHRRGAEMMERIVTACRERGVKYVTLYAFSEENWNRPGKEVRALMQLLRLFLESKKQKLIENRTRFVTVGDIGRLPPDIQEELGKMEEATKGGDGMTLAVALSYGARQEICNAVNRLLRKKIKKATPEVFGKELYTSGIPDPDLLIRTSGEYRISNFLLWQLAYTELYFTEKLWPDFDEAQLDKAIDTYRKRERRFGLTSEQVRVGK